MPCPQHAEAVIYLGKCGLVVKDCGQSTRPVVRKMYTPESTLLVTWESHFFFFTSLVIFMFPHLLFETRLHSKFRLYLKKPKGKGEGQDLTFLGMNSQRLGKMKYVTCLSYPSADAV